MPMKKSNRKFLLKKSFFSIKNFLNFSKKNYFLMTTPFNPPLCNCKEMVNEDKCGCKCIKVYVYVFAGECVRDAILRQLDQKGDDHKNTFLNLFKSSLSHYASHSMNCPYRPTKKLKKEDPL